MVIVNIIRLKPSDIYRKNGLIRGVQELFEYCSLTFASTGINLPMLDGHQEGYPPDDDYYLWHSTRRLFRRYPKPSHHERFVRGVSKKVP